MRAMRAMSDVCRRVSFLFVPYMPNPATTRSNRIHNEVETANKFGYAAPIWAGTQGMHLTMAHLFSFGTPCKLTAEFRFLRPVFWHDVLELYFGQKPGCNAGVGEYLLLLPNGKPAMSMAVEDVEYEYL